MAELKPPSIEADMADLRAVISLVNGEGSRWALQSAERLLDAIVDARLQLILWRDDEEHLQLDHWYLAQLARVLGTDHPTAEEGPGAPAPSPEVANRPPVPDPAEPQPAPQLTGRR